MSAAKYVVSNKSWFSAVFHSANFFQTALFNSYLHALLVSLDFSFQLTWSLRIRNVNRDDAGVYECQATTHPPQAIFVRLKVVGKLFFCLALQTFF